MKLDVLVPVFDPANPRSAIENMKLLADKSDADVLAFLHDDMEILDPTWQDVVIEVMQEYDRVGLMGFGGALGLGNPEIYKMPYDYRQLARHRFYSNMVDAEAHGLRTVLARKVAVLDGFSQIFRREAYEEMGGWQDALDAGLTFHMYDAWAACRMKELGWSILMLPIRCVHHGGKTSVSAEYDQWLHKQGINGDLEIHQRAHRIIYNRFRDVLPIKEAIW